jgi:hypothetical protein
LTSRRWLNIRLSELGEMRKETNYSDPARIYPVTKLTNVLEASSTRNTPTTSNAAIYVRLR